eukprot:CAMPEP_0178533564 /NCGR_PEP_ID=MMETSP0696-20121128/34557_1 /TAXON_ID=265572 /ORGANISM="Extubocellulus spinifer, Strain CCMP396" /LENGTH=70 /DNA_ID=CAMNT_0020165601 /DNA_START=363 /DNA_END=572 /DNA_ORIENTATION=+
MAAVRIHDSIGLLKGKVEQPVRIHDYIGMLKGKVEQPVHIPKVRGLIGFRKVDELKSNVVLSLFDSMTNV